MRVVHVLCVRLPMCVGVHMSVCMCVGVHMSVCMCVRGTGLACVFVSACVCV